MADHNSVVALGVLAGAASGPLATFFNEQLLVYVIMGASGGAAVAIYRWIGFKTLLQRLLIGALFGGGMASISVSILEAFTTVEVNPDGNLPSVIASASFVIGFAQERVGQYLLAGRDDDQD